MTFCSKFDSGYYFISIAISASKKIGFLIRSMKFLSPEVALYLYKFTMRPCMECCCHAWAGALRCNLKLLDKVKKICRTFGPSPALSLSVDPLVHCWNVASLSLSCRYLVDFHLKWLSRSHFLILEGSLLIIQIEYVIFLSLFLDITRMSVSTVSFLTQLDCEILCV